jgi:ribonuclease BN (tRNA processing enzyme)
MYRSVMNENPKIILYPLGTMGWIPSQGLQTTCFAFFQRDELIVIDAGTGLSRLLELKRGLFKPAWRGLRNVRIFLTHYHLDHVAGLFWIKGILGTVPITIYAPGADIYGCPAVETLDGLFRKPYSPNTLRNFGPNIAIEDLNLSGVSIGSGPMKLRVSVRHNKNHSDPSVALRFGDLFAIVTDTPPEEEVIGFVRGVRVLLHESWFDSSPDFESESDSLDSHREGPHTGSFGAGLIALRAGVSRLYLMHHNPERAFENAEEDAKRVMEKLGIECRAAKDMEPIEIW